MGVSQPRTYLVPEQQRVQTSSSGIFSWVTVLFQTSDVAILQRSGLDAFFFLRYLYTLSRVFLSLGVILIPVLIPLNLTQGKDAQGGVHGLDRLSWANVSSAHSKFYWAHLSMALIVITFMCYTIHTELLEYIRIRQAYLRSPQHRYQAFSNAILVTDIPMEFLNVPTLTSLYGIFPGGVRMVWINRDLSELAKKVEERSTIVYKLEAAETRLIRSSLYSCRDDHDLTKTRFRGTNHSRNQRGEPTWKQYLSEKDRDYTRLPIFGIAWMPSIPFVGQKVNTIHHCWRELARLNKEIERDQKDYEVYPLISSAFIQFNNQEAAYMACRTLVRCAPRCFVAHYLEASPTDVKWDNLATK